jgi:hypothetical protein
VGSIQVVGVMLTVLRWSDPFVLKVTLPAIFANNV